MYAVTRIRSTSAASAICGDLAKGPTISPSAAKFILGSRQVRNVAAPVRREEVVVVPSRPSPPIPTTDGAAAVAGGGLAGVGEEGVVTRRLVVVVVRVAAARSSFGCGILQGATAARQARARAAVPAAKRADGRERMRKREHERERRREEQTQHSLRSAHQDCAKRQRTSNISPESGRTGDGDREIHR